MPIQIQSQQMIIGWNTKDASLSITGNLNNTLDIQIQPGELQINTSQPKVYIDQSEAFAEEGHKNVRQLMQELVSYSRQQWSAGVARTVSQGNELGAIENDVDPIPQQAIYNAYELQEKEFGYGVIPSSPPRFDVEKGEVHISYNPARVINNTRRAELDIQYSPWQIDYFVKQYASMKIDFVPSKLNQIA